VSRHRQHLDQNRARIISPESGIHRPSYNGAPASQTLTKSYELLSPGFEAASNEVPGLAKQRVQVSTSIARYARDEASRQHWNNEFVAILFTWLFVRVMFMRRM